MNTRNNTKINLMNQFIDILKWLSEEFHSEKEISSVYKLKRIFEIEARLHSLRLEFAENKFDTARCTEALKLFATIRERIQLYSNTDGKCGVGIINFLAGNIDDFIQQVKNDLITDSDCDLEMLVRSLDPDKMECTRKIIKYIHHDQWDELAEYVLNIQLEKNEFEVIYKPTTASAVSTNSTVSSSHHSLFATDNGCDKFKKLAEILAKLRSFELGNTAQEEKHATSTSLVEQTISNSSAEMSIKLKEIEEKLGLFAFAFEAQNGKETQIIEKARRICEAINKRVGSPISLMQSELYSAQIDCLEELIQLLGTFYENANMIEANITSEPKEEKHARAALR